MVVESKKSVLWTGRVLTAIPALLMIASGVMKVLHRPEVIEGMVGKYGFDESALLPIGIVEVLCVALYLFPKTAVVGAILITGYLGGATVTHVRAGEPFIMPVILGVVAWAGLYLRDPTLRTLIPLRK